MSDTTKQRRVDKLIARIFDAEDAIIRAAKRIEQARATLDRKRRRPTLRVAIPDENDHEHLDAAMR